MWERDYTLMAPPRCISLFLLSLLVVAPFSPSYFIRHVFATQSNHQQLIKDLVALAVDFKQAIDLGLPDDKQLYTSITTRFSASFDEYLNIVIKEKIPLNSSLLCEVLTSEFQLRFNALKEHLQQNNSITLTHGQIQDIAPWSTDLLKTILQHCSARYTHFALLKPVCQHGLTPLELSIKFRLSRSVFLLLKHVSDTEKGEMLMWRQALLLAVKMQTKGIISALLNSMQQEHTSAAVYGVPDISQLSVNNLVSLYCWAGIDYSCLLKEHIEELVSIDRRHHWSHQVDQLSWLALQLHKKHSEGLAGDQWQWWSYRRHGGWLQYDQVTYGKQGCDFPYISILELSDFEIRVILSNISMPLIIKDAEGHWARLHSNWRKDTLLAKYADTDLLLGTVPYGEIFGETFGYATVGEFLQYLERQARNPNYPPLYVFDSEVMQTVFIDQYTLPGFTSLWNGAKQYHQFILGPSGSGAPYHYHCDAINILVYGRKKWFLQPPGIASYSKEHSVSWYHRNQYNTEMFPAIECTQEPDEILYIPAGWSHATINIDESIGLAVEFDSGDC